MGLPSYKYGKSSLDLYERACRLLGVVGDEECLDFLRPMIASRSEPDYHEYTLHLAAVESVTKLLGSYDRMLVQDIDKLRKLHRVKHERINDTWEQAISKIESLAKK